MNKQKLNEQQIQELLNRGIDGELDVAEQRELDLLLASSEEIRDLNEELKAFAGFLDQVPDREPPQYLHNAIISQVRLPVPGDAHTDKTGFFSTWFAAPWMRTGVAVAAALMLTIGIYQTGSENLSVEDTSSMTGTIVRSPNAQTGALIDRVQFLTATMKGTAELHNEEGLLSVSVVLESEGPAVLSLGFNGQSFAYEGITGLQNSLTDVSVAEGSIHVSTAGQQNYSLLLKDISENQAGRQANFPLVLEFYANNVLVHEAELGGSNEKSQK